MVDVDLNYTEEFFKSYLFEQRRTIHDLELIYVTHSPTVDGLLL